MEFKTVEVVYFVVVWLLAFIAGLWRTVRDHRYERWWDCFSIGIVGGFYGFATVAVLGSYGPSIDSFGWPYLGLAVAIGLLGKEQERIMRWVFFKALEKVTGSKFDERDAEDK